MKEPDSRHVMLTVIRRVLTIGNIPAGHVDEAAVGGTTVRANPKGFNIAKHPPARLGMARRDISSTFIILIVFRCLY